MYGYNKTIDLIDSLTPLSNSSIDRLGIINQILEYSVLNEKEYNKVVEHLKLEIMPVETFITNNECKEVTNPVFFVRNNIPTDDGLLSNSIFGITRDDRAGIFAYINLGGTFIDPSCYKTWIRMDSKIKEVIHGMDTYSVNEKGDIVPDPKGSNGIEFLKQNIDKIKFKSTESIKRDIKVKYLEKNKKNMFISKYIVIPPFYRDTNTGKGGTVGVGGINILYRNLILAVQALNSTQDYGFDNSGMLRARIQEIILQIYDWFAGNANASLNVETGLGLSGKRGILRMANMSKTTNYSSRMVIAAPEIKAESYDQMMVDIDHSALPLAACIANYRAYVMFHVKRFFENEFIGNELYPVISKDGKIKYIKPKEPLIAFSDEKIKREMDRFLHGYNNRLVPITIEGEDGKTYYMQFKGKYKQPGTESETIYNRRLTWCDVFYMCAVEASLNKTMLVTRYPIDSHFNQIATKIIVSSTKDTEPMYVMDKYYPFYPKITEDLIGTNTGNMFVDTLRMSNLHLKAMGGDYDGDTVTSKCPYTIEAIEELDEFTNSKSFFINLGGNNVKLVDADVVMSLYAITKVLDVKQITKPVFD